MAKLDQYYNRYDASHYDTMLWRADRVLQSAELNEAQSMSAARLKGVADVIFDDGDIVGGAGALMQEAGVLFCEPGYIYLNGAVYQVGAATLAVPMEGTVAVGVYLSERVITELEDPALYNPAKGTRAEGEAGAARLKIELRWGLEGEEGLFYGLYLVVNGVVLPRSARPTFLRCGIGADGEVLTARGGAAVWEAPQGGGGGSGGWDFGDIDLSGLIAHVPESLLAGTSKALSFSGEVTDALGLPVRLALRPLESGLAFAPSSDITLGQSLDMSAPPDHNGGRVSFALLAYGLGGAVASREFALDVLTLSADLNGLVARVPDSLPANASDYVVFDLAPDVEPDAPERTARLSFDPLDSGLSFAKLDDVALGERVAITAPDALAESVVTFRVTADLPPAFEEEAGGAQSVSTLFSLLVSVSPPDMSGLLAHLPETLVATQSGEVWFEGVRDPQGWPLSLRLDPLASGLAFDPVEIALDEFGVSQRVAMRAPDLAYDKDVTFQVTATNKAGLSTAKTLGLRVLGATPPNMQAFSHTIPPGIMQSSTIQVSFSGALGAASHAVRYRIDAGDSGLVFAKLEGIAANEWVELTAPYTPLPALPVSLTVYAVDDVTGKEEWVSISTTIIGQDEWEFFDAGEYETTPPVDGLYELTAAGAGAGGGGYQGAGGCKGAGGAGSGYISQTTVFLSADEIYPVTVGKGGKGGKSKGWSSKDGENGGASGIGDLITAAGGVGGKGSTATGGGAGGIGQANGGKGGVNLVNGEPGGYSEKYQLCGLEALPGGLGGTVGVNIPAQGRNGACCSSTNNGPGGGGAGGIMTKAGERCSGGGGGEDGKNTPSADGQDGYVRIKFLGYVGVE